MMTRKSVRRPRSCSIWRSLTRPGVARANTDHVLILTPKKPSARYKKLWLVVSAENFRVKQSVVLNIKGDINQFRFFEPINPPLKDSDFNFNEKANRDSRKIEAPPQSDE